MSRRLLLDVPLRPALGSRFQPTGFPDIGAAEFERPISRDGQLDLQRCLLVESAQSVANRLEGTAWDVATQAPVALFDGLPYLRVVGDDSRYLTSSRTEAHRLASAFVKDSTLEGRSMVEVLKERLGLRDDTPIPLRQVASAVFAIDPFCLVHGVFFADSKWPGQPKVARALTGFIEAHGVHRADSGGVKKDEVRHSLGDKGEGGGTAEGYGNVPYHRTEWTADEVVASFSLDRRQLESYGLGDEAAALLEAIALWEVRTLLEDGLRLRTACDLVPLDDELTDTSGAVLPDVASLEKSILSGVEACRGQLGAAGPVDVLWARAGAAKKKSS